MLNSFGPEKSIIIYCIIIYIYIHEVSYSHVFSCLKHGVAAFLKPRKHRDGSFC